jgi:hypothetical protein
VNSCRTSTRARIGSPATSFVTAAFLAIALFPFFCGLLLT